MYFVVCTTSLEETSGSKQDEYKTQHLATVEGIPFSAFWLRSSVVSVLISLISDTWANGPHDIKFIFPSRASPMRCTIARAWLTPPILVKDWYICWAFR
ncbi:unnamed protein product [Linum tenue]|uniref:Uncharacterized protein n=1 Tax=Linum tenue TaxID=586396 RepID=A0AAV0INS2_9ROSI|nr:unnamed protein product [Linum tenue]